MTQQWNIRRIKNKPTSASSVKFVTRSGATTIVYDFNCFMLNLSVLGYFQRSPSIYMNIEVIFHLKEIEVVLIILKIEVVFHISSS